MKCLILVTGKTAYTLNPTKMTSDYDSLTGNFDEPDTTTSSHFVEQNITHVVSLGLNRKYNKLRYQLGVSAQFNEFVNIDFDHDARHFVQRFADWIPTVFVIYNISPGTNFNISYFGSITTPSISQVQPTPDLTNPFNIKIGNPDLTQQFDHNISLNYTHYDVHTLNNIQLHLRAIYSEHSISNSTVLLAGGIQQVKFVNVEVPFNISAICTYGFPIGTTHFANIATSVSAQYANDVTLLNGSRDVNSAISIGNRTTISYHPLERLFIDANSIIKYKGTTYSLDPLQTNHNLTQHYGLNISYEFVKGVTLVSYYFIDMLGGQGTLPAQHLTLWNEAIFKTFLSDHSLELRLSVFDLLNNARNYSQAISQNYFETDRTNQRGRFGLLSLVWFFKQNTSNR